MKFEIENGKPVRAIPAERDRQIVIPEGVKHIDEAAFASCGALRALRYGEA